MRLVAVVVHTQGGGIAGDRWGCGEIEGGISSPATHFRISLSLRRIPPLEASARCVPPQLIRLDA